MPDSSAFEFDEQKRRLEEGQRLLLRLGALRFGPANADTEAALRSIADFDRLERLADAVFTARSWIELLATP